MHPGLSVSHDSVFHSPNSGSDMELDAAESSSSLSISQPYVDQRLQVSRSLYIYDNLCLLTFGNNFKYSSYLKLQAEVPILNNKLSNHLEFKAQ